MIILLLDECQVWCWEKRDIDSAIFDLWKEALMWRIAFEIEHASAPPQQSQSCGTKWAVLLRSVSEWLKGNKCKEGPPDFHWSRLPAIHRYCMSMQPTRNWLGYSHTSSFPFGVTDNELSQHHPPPALFVTPWSRRSSKEDCMVDTLCYRIKHGLWTPDRTIKER